MIKINLLPQQKRTKSTNIEKSAVYFALGIVILVASVFAVDYYFSDQLATLNASIAEKTQTRKILEQEVAKVNSVLQELNDIEGRIKIIKDVRLRQGLPVKYIDEIIVNMPQNKMWFETFTVSDNGIGIPKDGVLNNPDSLGLELVALLAEKLDGSTELRSGAGTEWQIRFQQLQYSERV